MNQEFDKSDLDTEDYYFVSCGNYKGTQACGKATRSLEDWSEAIAYAKSRGFQIEDGIVYCTECAELELQRQEEERIEEEGDDRYATRSDD